MALTRERLIEEYQWELGEATKMKEEGRVFVSAGTAGKELARGRDVVLIEEYITYWHQGLKALKNGASVESYNY
jgi:hypothetical protein